VSGLELGVRTKDITIFGVMKKIGNKIGNKIGSKIGSKIVGTRPQIMKATKTIAGPTGSPPEART
jgi:hypothetical protein